jgi:hypothetical protein
VVAQLKLFKSNETDDEAMIESLTSDADVRVRLGDLLPLVAFAQKLQFVWLKDFLDDEVKITEDLYQVLQSFRSMRPVA